MREADEKLKMSPHTSELAENFALSVCPSVCPSSYVLVLGLIHKLYLRDNIQFYAMCTSALSTTTYDVEYE